MQREISPSDFGAVSLQGRSRFMSLFANVRELMKILESQMDPRYYVFDPVASRIQMSRRRQIRRQQNLSQHR